MDEAEVWPKWTSLGTFFWRRKKKERKVKEKETSSPTKYKRKKILYTNIQGGAKK